MIDVNEVIIVLNDVEKAESEKIRRCLNTLYSVREGEQPLDREFGLAQDFLDQPMPAAQNLLALEIIKKTARYEPRVIVEKVEYEHREDGTLIPIVNLKRGEM